MVRWSWSRCLNTTGTKTGSARLSRRVGRRVEDQARRRLSDQRLIFGKNQSDNRDYTVYDLTIWQWMVYGGQGVAVWGMAAYIFYRSWLMFFLFIPMGFLYPLYKKRSLKKERFRQLEIQFKEGIQILSSFLEAGYSLENGMSLSVMELETLYGDSGMIVQEFDMISRGLHMNRNVEELFMDFGRRSGLEDVDHFTQVLAAAKRSGGNLVEVISQTAGIIRDKVQVKEEIYTMLASRIFEQRIMNWVPFLIVLYIDITSPGFFNIMYQTWLGRAVMTVCLTVYGSALLLASRIMDIEV